MKKLVSYQIEEKTLDRFKLIARVKDETQTSVIERLMRDYIVINTAGTNEKVTEILDFLGKK